VNNQDNVQAKEFRYSGAMAKGTIGMTTTERIGIDDQSVRVVSPQAQLMAPDDAWAIFDEAAQYYLGITGEAFIRAVDAGEFDDDPDRPEVISLVMLRPGGR
jgi:hypothetical protein